MLHNTSVVYFDQNIWSEIAKDNIKKNFILSKQDIGQILLTIYPTHLFETQQIVPNTNLKDDLIHAFKNVRAEIPHFYEVFKDEINRQISNEIFLNHYLKKIDDIPFNYGTFELEGATSQQRKEFRQFMESLNPFFYDILFSKYKSIKSSEYDKNIILDEMLSDKQLFQSLKKPNDKNYKEFVLLYFKNLCTLMDITYFDNYNDTQLFKIAMSLPSFSVHIKLKCELYNNKTGKIDYNDFIDINFLSTAIPYCDIVVLEKKWCNVCKSLNFEKNYNVTLFSNIDMFINHINF